ncbi:hypothetical protein DSL64_09355 [Dyadobacter luteus]|uniref:Gingipain domain-containing protein n=1 Tax=Dyadobacter luteus TaxID=2259619 RepID=A0A3D8YD90_9BACT|nr:C25 family cysteine peptidase [Dyadobacter luteus]REA62450.1 hypothetical protein DSL64_09355 [Dyadobacter luteus]
MRFFLFSLILVFVNVVIFAQSQSLYTNDWIVPDQQYVKIRIEEKGIFKVPFSSLPTSFNVNDVDKLQLFFRGKEVPLISTDNNEILFYGVPNDGSSDSLLYRPMSSRYNVHSSLYSDVSSYFLTSGKKKGKRVENKAFVSDSAPLSYHMETYLKTFLTEYSFSTEKHAVPSFINSFFELGAARTGERLEGNKLIEFSYEMDNYLQINLLKPHVKILLHGMFNTSRTLEIYVKKKDGSSLRKVGDLFLNGFEGKLFEFDLDADDFSVDGKGSIFFKSNNNLERERFSVSFYSIDFPQRIDANVQENKWYNLPPNADLLSRLEFKGLSNEFRLLDISDIYNIKSVDRVNSVLSRVNGKSANVVLFKNSIAVGRDKCIEVKFNTIDPKLSNYIIITNGILTQSAGRYANYRKSTQGGSFKASVFYIKDIYDQFNYGEVSPVAIRNFVQFMLSDGNKEKYLFLLGKSINPLEKMPKELEDCIPAVGYPASDLLLVTGLAGEQMDVPAIPIGRLMAVEDQNVDDYLNKVRDYEKEEGEFAWRKNILHLSGGKTESEIRQFKDALSALVPTVEQGSLGGNVKGFFKNSTIEVENVNIASEINEGVGMLTYFGHGSRTTTDLNFGYISDASKGYNNYLKYPIMYFNGCGVGNVFRGLFNPSPTASDRRPLSMDWTLSKDRGAIAIMANSYESYVNPSLKYLQELYNTLFTDYSISTLSIGQIQRETAKHVVAKGANIYDVANLHQTVLQGDPAIRFINVSKPDYSISQDEGIFIKAETGKSLENSNNAEILVVVENKGRVVVDEVVPIRIKYVSKGVDMIIEKNSLIGRLDTIRVEIGAVRDLRRIEVEIDPGNIIEELNENNNISELIIDWDLAKDMPFYPMERVIDIVPPTLSVSFNGSSIVNNQTVSPNPKIKMAVSDDRFLSKDANLLDIFLKNCSDESCDFVKLDLSNEEFELNVLSNNSIEVLYSPKTMLTGDYELLVNAKDSRNNSIVNAYRIRFNIFDIALFKVIAFPNPATDYVLFKTDYLLKEGVSYIDFKIYDTLGRMIENKKITKPGDWYWYPKSLSGLFYCKATLILSNGEVKTETNNKIIVVK